VDPDSKRLRVVVTDGAGRPVRDGGLAAWLSSVAPARASGEVAIALVSDARIRALNRRYRRKDRATDVLSFSPAPGSRPLASGLGDIVIATGVARRQAKEAGHSTQAELRVLALHGLLHLLGYDHHHIRDERRMARAEARLRRKGGLRSGLIERAAGATSGTSAAFRRARA
jgi:probable rRNA maturation factor